MCTKMCQLQIIRGICSSGYHSFFRILMGVISFILHWVATSSAAPNKKEDIKKKCAELVPNLDAKDLFISFDEMCSPENYKQPNLMQLSSAVKYYLRSISTRNRGYHSLLIIHDISISDSTAFGIMGKYEVNFSHGISLPTHEVLTNPVDLELAVVHSRNIHNAHHDLILPARTSIEIVNIAVQAKASFNLSGKNTIAKQGKQYSIYLPGSRKYLSCTVRRIKL